jgi:hypothetical protein
MSGMDQETFDAFLQQRGIDPASFKSGQLKGIDIKILCRQARWLLE